MTIFGVSVDGPRRLWDRVAFIKRFLAISCILVGGLSCPSETMQRPVPPDVEAGASLVLFFTGNEMGALKPCGCSGGQLGGLSKRTAVFDRVSPQRRLILDTGNLIENDAEQDLIKFRILFEAFSLLEYDLVRLTRRDAEIAGRLGLAAADRTYDVLNAEPPGAGAPWAATWSKAFDSDGRQILVHTIALDAQTDSADRASEFFSGQPEGPSVDLVILENADEQARRQWAQDCPADCIICPADSDEPRIFSHEANAPLVISVGRLGRYITRLDVRFPQSSDEPVFQFQGIAVNETLPEAPALVRLYEQYQQIVADSGLLESHPRLPLPDGLEYIGSESCKQCHGREHAAWSEKAHADAFATLVRVGSDRDPECVVCHVVGMDYEGGFVTLEKTPHLKDVGCENCHGPGSKHAKSGGVVPSGEPKQNCLACHTPEHSSGYAGHEEEFRQKIKHWWEP